MTSDSTSAETQYREILQQALDENASPLDTIHNILVFTGAPVPAIAAAIRRLLASGHANLEQLKILGYTAERAHNVDVAWENSTNWDSYISALAVWGAYEAFYEQVDEIISSSAVSLTPQDRQELAKVLAAYASEHDTPDLHTAYRHMCANDTDPLQRHKRVD